MFPTLFKAFTTSAFGSIKTLPIIPAANAFTHVRTYSATNHLMDYDFFPKKSLSPKELKTLVNTLEVLLTAFKGLPENQLKPQLNKYRWSPTEKVNMSVALLVLQKEPKDVKGADFKKIAQYVQTRNAQQCRSFLDYRIRIGMPGYV
ncbi:hypothetical protein INT47_004081 [Mucor saturninus]|uniref:Uncharacterized protein n=1 Tax=Mucor saturninus TaxID=64648 RepID=A0A8H7R5I2_9FUNG|nr:hypothetical protein INT47_004081 [Mucor saturninus]